MILTLLAILALAKCLSTKLTRMTLKLLVILALAQYLGATSDSESDIVKLSEDQGNKEDGGNTILLS